jgi:MFS transporter, DHA1 family, staphyloferrin A biosynthesis exporter
LPNIKTLGSLKNPAFRFYFFGMMGQWGAVNMQMVTNALLIYRLSGSAAILGVMSLANAVPTLLLSLFCGALADRFKKKRLIQLGQAASALVSLSVAVALKTGYMSTQHPGSWWVLIATSAFQGIFNAVMMPARQAMIPSLVSKEQVMNAVSINSMGQSVFQLVAPAVAGFLIDAINFESVYYIMTVLFVTAIVLTNFIPSTAGVASGLHTGNPFADVVEGIKYMLGKPTILLILAFTMAGILLGEPLRTMLAIFTDDILKVGATGLGILQSVAGAGALVVSIFLASLPNKKRGIIMMVAGTCYGLAILIFAFSRLWPLSIGMMVCFGIARTTHIISTTTMLQTNTDEQYLGRVMSILAMNMGISSFGTFLCGVFTETVGVQWAVGGFGMCLALLFGLGLLFMPKLRKLD